jgi:hypothetical protein
MKLPGHDELANAYRSASDATLVEIAQDYDSLTPAAQGVLRAEFDRRGLQPPEVPDASPVATYQCLVTIRQYRDLSEAQVARGVLESAGMPCYLRDDNAVRLEWVWSNLLGGVRLQVRDEDREAAEEILTQPIPEQIPLDGNEHFDQPRCPSCSRSTFTSRPFTSGSAWHPSWPSIPYPCPNVPGSAQAVAPSGGTMLTVPRTGRKQPQTTPP